MKILLESKRDDFLNQYIPLLQKRGIETTVGQLKSYLLNKFGVQFGIHNLSKPGTYFLAGVTRYYFEGLLTSNKRLNVLYPNVQDKPIQEICVRLDALIDILRNAYIDSVGTQFEQPEDFGTLSLEKLLKKYNKKINQYLGIDEPKTKNTEEESKIDQSTDAGKNYTYEILYSYDDAKKFNQWTTPGAWCITYGEQHYNAYVRRLGIHYVVFMRKGFENVPRKVGKGFTKQKPHDEYGNSLICVLQSNKSPEPVYITSRWNHGYGDTAGTEADHAYTKEEFLNIIGCDESVLNRCFEQWRETVKKNKENSTDKNSKNREEALKMLRNFKYAQMMVNNGAKLNDFFKEGYLIAGKLEKPMKSVLLVGMKNEGTDDTYYSICDRGQIRFDQYFVKCSRYNRPQVKNLNNAVISLYNDDKTYFYSIKKRSLLDADGVKQFAKVDWDLTRGGYWNEDASRYAHYYMVAARGNQIAVLDTKAGDFLTAPNGHRIFESVVPCQGKKGSWNSYDSNIDYSRHIRLFDINDSGFLRMVYDSSANIVYIYDLNTNSFLNLNGTIIEDANSGIPGEKTVWKIAMRGYAPPTGYVKYVTDLRDYRDKYKFLNINTGEPLNVLGYSVFRDFRNCGDMVYAFWPADVEKAENDRYSDLDMFYDVQKQDLLKINDKPVIGSLKDYDYTKGYVLISPDRNSICYIYNPYTKEFYMDDKGNMLFYYNGNSYNSKNLKLNILGDDMWKGVVVDSFELPPAEEAVNTMKESVKKDFYDVFSKLWK